MNATFSPVQVPEALPTIDFDALVAARKRNHDAAVETCRVAAEGFKAIARRQSEMLEANVAELQSRIGKLESPVKYLELAAAMTRRSFEHVREIAEMAARTNKEVLALLVKRSNDAVAELEAAVKVAKA